MRYINGISLDALCVLTFGPETEDCPNMAYVTPYGPDILSVDEADCMHEQVICEEWERRRNANRNKTS